jgi:pimeloyl-ACP methyl ester carboxylesterase
MTAGERDESAGLPHFEEWGAGEPLIALHALALESSGFSGVAKSLSRRGLRTLAVDLPGFGRTPAPDGRLTPARLAEPVLELARKLERPPILLGHSLGGRVALEVALRDPGAVRGVVLVAPYLPLRGYRLFLDMARHIDPGWAERLPLERLWPVLKRVAERLEARPHLEDDWLARATVRVVYYSTCPATRAAFLSASRELALDPATGPDSLWSRLEHLEVPATFLWAGRDALIPRSHHAGVGDALPSAHHVESPCAGHFVSGAHFRCMRNAIVTAVMRTIDAADHHRPRVQGASAHTLAPCLADLHDLEEPTTGPVAQLPIQAGSFIGGSK